VSRGARWSMRELMERGSRIITRCGANSSFSSEKPIQSFSGKRGQNGRLSTKRRGGIQSGTGRHSLAPKAANGHFSMERDALQLRFLLRTSHLFGESDGNTYCKGPEIHGDRIGRNAHRGYGPFDGTPGLRARVLRVNYKFRPFSCSYVLTGIILPVFSAVSSERPCRL
jgi:hypothetical protein